jgi:hypothetical protein
MAEGLPGGLAGGRVRGEFNRSFRAQTALTRLLDDFAVNLVFQVALDPGEADLERTLHPRQHETGDDADRALAATLST